MKSKYVFSLLCLLLSLATTAQELTVKSMKAAPMDLSASQYERKDLAGQPCGLVKVQLATTGATFEGNVIRPVENKAGEYWVYMSEGSYMLSVKHPGFIPLDVNFRDYGIQGIQGKATYKLTLLMPERMQKLTINYTPATAMVIVDSKVYRGNGRIELKLPVGDHNYIIAQDGYNSIDGIARLNATSPRTITETLVRAEPLQNSVAPTTPQPASQSVLQKSSQSDVAKEDIRSESSVSSNLQDIETITVKGVSFNMVRVDGGTFQMGATSEQKDPYDDEKPVHQVTLSGYYIGETEVTQGLWEAVMGSNPSKFKERNLPVECVSWDDCQAFIQKLNQLTGRRFRLPTEAEWEYAARGGNRSRSYQYSGSNNLKDVAWCWENSGDAPLSGEWNYAKMEGNNCRTHDVKTKQSNELGLYDMSGNVWEWCQDWYGDYSSSAQTNPQGPSSGSDRVYRGGGWDGNARRCRVSNRGDSTPDNWYIILGLRLAL